MRANLMKLQAFRFPFKSIFSHCLIEPFATAAAAGADMMMRLPIIHNYELCAEVLRS